MLSERELVNAVIAGDQDAATELYHAHAKYVRSVIFRFAPVHHHDDLVQETFARIFAKLHLWRGTCQLRTWIHRIAFNTGLMHWRNQNTRKARNTVELDNEDMNLPEPSVMPNYMPKFELDRVMKEIRRLPRRARQVAYLLVQEGTIKEVAAVTGMGIGGAKSYRSRTRERLRKKLEEGQRV